MPANRAVGAGIIASEGRGFVTPKEVTPFCARRAQCRAAGAEGLHPEEAGGFFASGGRGALCLEARYSIFFRVCSGGRLCAAVSAVRRATDAAHPLRVLPARRAGGTEHFSYSPEYRSCGDTAAVAPRAYFFLSCQKKVCKKEAQDAKIALTRGKAFCYIVRVVVTLAVKERPSGDRRIGFPHRTANHTSRYVSAR